MRSSEGALAAAERISAAERGLDAEAARLREEGAHRIEQEAERARAEATAAASAAIAEREQELERAKAETEQTKAEAERIGREAVERARAEVAAIRSEAEQSAAGARSPELETELAATKRRLEEAIARAEEAERTVATLTDSSREEAAQERELRFQEIEGTIGELEAKANAATEHHVVDPPAPETAAPEPAESPTTEPTEGTASIAELAAEAEALAAQTQGSAQGADPAPGAELTPPEWVPSRPESADPVSLASAEVDDLIAIGMSVTQAKRVLNYREEHGGFDSADDLYQVPGFPRPFLDRIKDRLVP